ncbi:MAG: calcineurin-like phosphoesterase family protein [Caldilineaceae bacterium]
MVTVDAGATLAAPAPQDGTVVTGMVFEDQNNNQIYDAGEPGIADVAVSNGVDVVQTAADGSYSLPLLEDTVYFVTKPADYMAPVDANMAPHFYYIHYPNGSPDYIQEFRGIDPTGEMPASLDFPLYALDEAMADDEFTFLAIGDPQVRDYKELVYFRDDIVADIVKERGMGADFAITLGDMLSDQLTMYGHYQQTMGLAGLPTYYVPGNHDMDVDAIDDTHHLDTYISHFGPTNYSFDHGNAHFVMLDNIRWLGATPNHSVGNFTDGFSAQALTWLANDLATVPKEKLIVLGMHIPLVTKNDAPPAMTPGGDRDALYALLADYEVLALTGHSHVTEVDLPGDEMEAWGAPMPFTHINAGAACGGWWAGPEDERGIPLAYQRDGAPNGYFVIDLKGNEIAPRLKGANVPIEKQMNVSLLNRWDLQLPPNSVTTGELGHAQLAVNVWAGSSQTAVTCSFDNGAETTGMRNPFARDPFATARQQALDSWMLENRGWQNLLPPPIRAKIGPENWMQTNSSWHMWSCPLPADLEPGAHRVTAVVDDGFGQTFTEPYLFDLWATQ